MGYQFWSAARRAYQVHGQLVTILKHRLQHVGRCQCLMAAGERGCLRALHYGTCTFCILVDIHIYPLPKADSINGQETPLSGSL